MKKQKGSKATTPKKSAKKTTKRKTKDLGTFKEVRGGLRKAGEKTQDF